MSKHKSQHFVPKCYLKNFAQPQDFKTISLMNFKKNLIIESAPIKSQCSRSYFYGNDEFELVLSEVESKYAEWITRGLLAKPARMIDGLDDFIRFFVMIQYGRTEEHAARMRAYYALSAELIGLPEDHPDFIEISDMETSQIAREGIYFALKCREAIEDLKVSYIHNESEIALLTSDNPVVLTNRLHLQKFDAGNFGVANAGTVILAIIYFN